MSRGPDSTGVAIIKVLFALVIIGVCLAFALNPNVEPATSIVLTLVLTGLLALVLFV